MGHTNETSNYHLSQFLGTDKPAWLQDYNGDMQKIDTGINGAKVAADAAQLSADTAQSTANTAVNGVGALEPAVVALQSSVGTLSGNVNTINSLIGNGEPTTTDKTLIGAINEIHGTVGDTPLATTAQTVTGAINELVETELANYREIIKIAHDGTKTYADALAAISTEFNGLTTDEQRRTIIVDNNKIFHCGATGTNNIFTLVSGGASQVSINSFGLRYAEYNVCTITTSGAAFTTKSTDVMTHDLSLLILE